MTTTTINAVASDFRTRRFGRKRLVPATSKPTTIAVSAVRVWVSTRMMRAGPTTTMACRPDNRRQNQSRVVRPASSAAKCATCVGGIGQSVPLRRPPSSLPGEMSSPKTTEPRIRQEKAHLTAQDEAGLAAPTRG